MAYYCNLWYKRGLHALKIVRNDISHLIIELLVYIYIFFNIRLRPSWIFADFLPNATYDSCEILGERYMIIWGTQANFQLSGQISTLHSVYTSAILNFK